MRVRLNREMENRGTLATRDHAAHGNGPRYGQGKIDVNKNATSAMYHTLMTHCYIVEKRGGEPQRDTFATLGEKIGGELVTLEPCVRVYARGSGSHYRIGKTNRCEEQRTF
jgi:hypothetical protein